VLSLLGVAGCARDTPRQDEGRGRRASVSLERMTDEQKLMLFTHIPLGATQREVREIVPALGTRRPEGMPGSGLSDATLVAEVLGHRTRLEFNFRDDTLYSVSFGPMDLPADSGDALFDRISGFYSGRLGEPIIEDGQDSPYYVRMRSWPVAWGEVGVINSLARERRILGWGYQRGSNSGRKR
jgi:hypothetical protein